MKRLLTTQEVAEYLGKSPWWIRENIGTLGIPAIKVGRHWRYREEDIESWLMLKCIANPVLQADEIKIGRTA